MLTARRAAIIVAICLLGSLVVHSLIYHSNFSIYILTLAIFTVISLIAVSQRRDATLLNQQKNEVETQLAEEKYRFQSIFENATHCIATLSLDGHFIRINNAFAELLGYSKTEILAMNYFYLISQHDVSSLQIYLQELLDNKITSHQSEHECFKKNGEAMWIKSTISVVRDKNGKPSHYILQAQNISTHKQAEERLTHMAYHDPLTGLANRNKLEQHINHLLLVSKRQIQPFGLLYLDLDGFKTINDTLGHDAGDLLLQVIAQRLQNVVRATDMVTRLGGDEFVVLVTEIKKDESIALIATKILESVLEAIVVKGKEIYITTSIGMSIFPHDGDNLQTLMKNADLALYRAKECGRNNYQFYTREMTGKALEKMVLKKALEKAIANDEFHLHYQPKMKIATREITGVEALLRWKNEQFKGVTPDEIIALAEESGLIIPVSEWILRTACKQLKIWHDMGFPYLSMAINCTTRQFKQSTFISEVSQIIADTGVLSRYIDIEVTEGMIMKDPDNILRILDALRQIGVKITIDDFGTGYWSIGNLRKLSVDNIKIDKTFIKQLLTDKVSADITSAIIVMVNKLGITSVAEGVETKEQFDFLATTGCFEMQGYYLTPALPSDRMTHFLKHPMPDAERIQTIETV